MRSTAPPRRITDESSRSLLPATVEERRRPSGSAAAAGRAAAAIPAAAVFAGAGLRLAGPLPPVVSSSQDARGAWLPTTPREIPSPESLRRDIADGLPACSPRKLDDDGVAEAAAAAPASAPLPPSLSLVSFLTVPPPFPFPCTLARSREKRDPMGMLCNILG